MRDTAYGYGLMQDLKGQVAFLPLVFLLWVFLRAGGVACEVYDGCQRAWGFSGGSLRDFGWNLGGSFSKGLRGSVSVSCSRSLLLPAPR